MRWFRDHIRQGSLAALMALVVNLTLSFGHVHAIGVNDRHLTTPQIATSLPADDGGSPGHHDRDQADLLCPICIAAGAIGHALAAAAPTLAVALVETPADLTIRPVFKVSQPPRAAFQSRGPPTS